MQRTLEDFKRAFPDRAVYLTDDRDLPVEDQRTLVIFQCGNGDSYVQVAPAHGFAIEGVRLCTSGGASSHCPGLTVAIAEAYRAMQDARNGVSRSVAPSYGDLRREVDAWRRRAPGYEYDPVMEVIARSPTVEG